MKRLNLDDVTHYVEDTTETFHTKRLEKLDRLKLNNVLKRKNPYLFKAKYILTAEALVRTILDAYLSSQEETLFGDFLEGVAIFVAQQVFDGYKPETNAFEGLDLIFEDGDTLYIVEVKSGPHWGNSSQIRKMMNNFEAAQAVLAPQYPSKTIVCVNGCCYGKERNHSKKDGAYWKLCGQDFWRFISGDDDLYQAIIEPLSAGAKVRNEAFDIAYAKLINTFTLQFGSRFCDDEGAIDWERLVAFVSKRDATTTYPFGEL